MSLLHLPVESSRFAVAVDFVRHKRSVADDVPILGHGSSGFGRGEVVRIIPRDSPVPCIVGLAVGPEANLARIVLLWLMPMPSASLLIGGFRLLSVVAHHDGVFFAGLGRSAVD